LKDVILCITMYNTMHHRMCTMLCAPHMQPITQVDSAHPDVIHSVTAVAHNAASYLVLCTEAGVQVGGYDTHTRAVPNTHIHMCIARCKGCA
jgi:hypothetical protein